MPDSSEHARIVLSAVIPRRLDLLDYALRQLLPTHFQDQTLSNIFVLLERYAEATGAVLPRAALTDMLRTSVDTGRLLLYEETYDALADRTVDDSDFRWSVQQLRELEAERATGQALTQSMEILRTGVTDDRGTLLKGHVDSRQHLLSRFAEIDRELSMQDSPEGDMRLEANEMLEDYDLRKRMRSSGRSRGVLFGITDLDFKVVGLQPGELCLVVGYAADGKTSMCVQLAWSAAVEQGLNVVILTTETLRPQVRRKLLARHSVLPQFALPEGLNTRDLKNGTLPPDAEQVFSSVVSDFTKNPAYGKCYIAQVPRGATVGTCEARLLRYSRQFPVDLVIVDYLALLRSDRRRSSDREELGAIVKEAKQLATTFADGKGVPLVSPWQVNRTAREQAERAGYYTSASTAETAETTNSCDVMVSLLAPMDNESRYAEVVMQVLKNRDGEKASSLAVRVDYATSRFASAQREQGMGALLGDEAVAGTDDYSALLSGV